MDTGLLAGLGASLAVLVAIVVGLLTRKDRGLMRDAETGMQLHWRKRDLPLMVMVDPDIYHWVEDFKTAVTFLNGVVPNLFLFQGEAPEEFLQLENLGAGLILVRGSDTVEDAAHTNLKYDSKSGTLYAAPIVVGRRANAKLRLRIAVHELGHTLGLDHDDFENSVMYPKAIRSDWRLTDADRELLREWYG